MDTVGIQKEIKTAMADRNEPWEVMLTKGSGDAETLSRAWAEQSSDPLRIYAMGGDGTLNEVVNGVVGHDHVSQDLWPGELALSGPALFGGGQTPYNGSDRVQWPLCDQCLFRGL